MLKNDQLEEAFARGMQDGPNCLSPADREIFRIQDFIIEYEMGGLSSYFYNRLPDLDEMRAAATAMHRHGLTNLADLLEKAVELFAGYSDPDLATTWDEVCRQYDSAGQLDELDSRIGKLDNYGVHAEDNA